MDHNLEEAALKLAEQDCTVLSNFLGTETIEALRLEAEQYVQEQRFREAGVGRGSGQAVRAGIRSDQILWLNEQEPTPAQSAYWSMMDELRQTLNRHLFLSLVSLEAHYAVYAPGAFYQKHVDRFQSSDERMISTTLYLNPEWRAEDGGQLRLYLEMEEQSSVEDTTEVAPERFVDVLPLAGTLALFRSDAVPHEVLPASRTRYSLTGWFRRRSLRPF